MQHTKYQGHKPYGFRRGFCLCKTGDPPPPPRWAIVWPQGYNLNKFGRGSLGDTSYPISSSRSCGFRQEDLFMFLQYIAYVNHVMPGRGHFSPLWHNLNKLDRGPLGDAIEPNIKAPGHMVPDKKIFSCVSYRGQCKTCDPRGWPFLAPGI